MGDAVERPDADSQAFDLDEINQLIELMNANQLTEIQIRDGEREIRLAREAPPAPVAAPPVALSDPGRAPALPSAEAPAAGIPAADHTHITSPMVGTFYQASSPEADPFVNVGSRVEKDTVVCMIEAMKVFNEIRAEAEGTIVEVLVENNTTVEYGQPLFLIEPD